MKPKRYMTRSEEGMDWIQNSVERVRSFLPEQKPLKDFIHHNPLSHFVDDEFHLAQKKVFEVYGSINYLSLSDYFKKLDEGVLERQSVLDILSLKAWDQMTKNEIIGQIDNRASSVSIQKPKKLRSFWQSEFGLDVISSVQPRLFKLVGHFLDQGVSLKDWPIDDLSFLESIQEMERTSFVSLLRAPKFSKGILALSPQEILKTCLERIVGDPRHFDDYLLEMSLEHPGWSGMVSVIEKNPSLLSRPRKVSLLEFLALELLLEFDFLISEKGLHFVSPKIPDQKDSTSELSLHFKTLEVLQDAFEWRFHSTFLDEIREGLKIGAAIESKGPEVQVFFCIDDRNCSIRRHLESLNPKIETFGVPGHFGLDYYFLPARQSEMLKMCPVPLKAGHVLMERQETKGSGEFDLFLHPSRQTLVWSWILSYILGWVAGLRLVRQMFSPGKSIATSSALDRINVSSTPEFLKSSDQPPFKGLSVGFELNEIAERVHFVLRSAGLVDNFAPLVVICGHGATTSNNPHYAAYECGACSGKPGGLNARVFSEMANLKEVRALLAAKGINIPNSTIFVGALHDTARDEVHFFGEPESLSTDFKMTLAKALESNAKERSERFLNFPSGVSSAFAHRRAKQRSFAIYETRPELNHTNNCLLIIGQRALTKGVFLDRRAFLNSYDPKLDPTGELLLQILKAAIPVCVGINLEYYFSRVANRTFGAGTKLPHNVVGLIGVANGTEGDLKTGLPLQMVDLHDPLRLLVLVQSSREIVDKVLFDAPEITKQLANRWFHLVVLEGPLFEFYKWDSPQKYLPFFESPFANRGEGDGL